MGRKCSHCGNIGHNSRTCTNYNKGNVNSTIMVGGGGGFRLFGVQLESPHSMVMKKCLSMDCFPSSSPLTASASHSPSSSSSLSSSRVSLNDLNSEKINDVSVGYLSDGLIARAQERKKGLPWSEDEHRRFLRGLEKLGKGDWRGISRNFVTTRTPTQVASHAQKYFLRQATLVKKKRRSSLFDLVRGNNHNKNVPGPLENNKEKSYNNNNNVAVVMSQTTSSCSVDEEEEYQNNDNNNNQLSTRMMLDLKQDHENVVVYSNHPTVKKSYEASKCSSLLVHPSSSQSGNHHHQLDLELKLAAPKPIIMDQNKSSSSTTTTRLQLGPIISVT